jgi:hypothetical protein
VVKSGVSIADQKNKSLFKSSLKPSKGAIIKGNHALSGLYDSLDAYLRCAPLAIVCLRHCGLQVGLPGF